MDAEKRAEGEGILGVTEYMVLHEFLTSKASFDLLSNGLVRNMS